MQAINRNNPHSNRRMKVSDVDYSPAGAVAAGAEEVVIGAGETVTKTGAGVKPRRLATGAEVATYGAVCRRRHCNVINEGENQQM